MGQIGQQIRKAREARGKTQDELAAHLDIKRESVAQWEGERGSSPRPNRLVPIAEFLDVPVAFLTGDDDAVPDPSGEPDRFPDVGPLAAAITLRPKKSAPNVSFPPQYQEFARDAATPLMGQTATGPNGRFVLNGQKIRDVFTPPDLVGVDGGYAVQVYGTSMEPKFEAGETVWINPHRPVRSGDYVVAQIFTEEENTFESYLKRFVSLTKSTLTLRQLNPGEGEEEVLTFPAKKVFSVHKVVFAAFV